MNKAKLNLLDATIPNSNNLNEQSIIILIQYNSYKILLMGDATNHNEEKLIHKYHLSNVNILKLVIMVVVRVQVTVYCNQLDQK